jgi:hypothetical protein
MDRLLAEFAAIGLAQALPGLRRMREVAVAGMDAEIAKLEALLAQCGGIVPNGHRPVGRPKKKESAVIAEARRIEAGAQNGAAGRGHNFWGNMTPEERSAEIARRWKLREASGTGGMRRMPKEARSKLSKSYWGRMTPEERVKEMNRRIAVSRGKAKPVDPASHAAQLARRARKAAEVQA